MELYFVDLNAIMHLSMLRPRGLGGGGSSNPQEFDCEVYSQGGDFDHSILSITKSRRVESHTLGF